MNLVQYHYTDLVLCLHLFESPVWRLSGKGVIGIITLFGLMLNSFFFSRKKQVWQP